MSHKKMSHKGCPHSMCIYFSVPTPFFILNKNVSTNVSTADPCFLVLQLTVDIEFLYSDKMDNPEKEDFLKVFMEFFEYPLLPSYYEFAEYLSLVVLEVYFLSPLKITFINGYFDPYVT